MRSRPPCSCAKWSCLVERNRYLFSCVSHAIPTRFLICSPTLSPACSPPFILIPPHGRLLLSSSLFHCQSFLSLSLSRASPTKMSRSSFIGRWKSPDQKMTALLGRRRGSILARNRMRHQDHPVCQQ